MTVVTDFSEDVITRLVQLPLVTTLYLVLYRNAGLPSLMIRCWTSLDTYRSL